MNTTTIYIIVIAASSGILLFSLGQLRQLLREYRTHNKKHERKVRAIQYNIQDMLEVNEQLDQHIEEAKQRIERNNRFILVMLIVMIAIAFFMAYSDE